MCCYVVLNLCAKWWWVVSITAGSITPGKEPSTHWIWNWADPRAGMTLCTRDNFLFVLKIEPWYLSCSAHSLVTLLTLLLWLQRPMVMTCYYYCCCWIITIIIGLNWQERHDDFLIIDIFTHERYTGKQSWLNINMGYVVHSMERVKYDVP